MAIYPVYRIADVGNAVNYRLMKEIDKIGFEQEVLRKPKIRSSRDIYNLFAHLSDSHY